MKSINHLKKSSFKLAMMAIFLFSFSCSPETDMNSLENLEAVNAHAKNGEKVEHKWIIKGSGTFAADFTVDCGGLLPIKIEGDGEASHIGRYNVVIEWCSLGLGNPNDILTGIITTAIGDEIWFKSTKIEPFVIDYEVTGGTGRFEEAEGEFTLTQTEFNLDSGENEPPSGTYTNEGGGFIKYKKEKD